MPKHALIALALACAAALPLPASAQSAPSPSVGPLTIAGQGSFFIGGRDLHSDTLSTLPAYAPSGTITSKVSWCFR